ncbi:aromatic acid exporter family protein [Brevibacillus invocatus]|nr:aromatic acid exporter family protein [Brevibacillus invocatus]MCM3080407.1 aromatic acid exporter family protein [Brevibacillus invocatus]MCM3430671.1 aromatic acid exporter family protein [Brevibacillus invocatus]
MSFFSFRIGNRTIKTAIGTAISIFIAQQLGLMYYAAAGIITILCIQVTVKQSFRTAINRFLASLLGIGLGVVWFKVLGFTPLALLVTILVFMPLAVRVKIQEGFVTCMVVLMHLYAEERTDLAFIANELSILVIGVGVALLVNLYMPSLERELKAMQQRVEDNFIKILKEFSYYLRHGESTWDGRELIETTSLLEQAIKLASRDVENRLGRGDDYYRSYFVMREKQFELLERMMPIVSTLNSQVPQGLQIADFLDHLSDSVHPGNTAYRFLDQLRLMRQEIKETPLPQTREEFETRAALFYLLREIENYLYIKHELGKNRDDSSGKKQREAAVSKSKG